jgi:hypothetical protein
VLYLFDILFGCFVEESIKLREICNVPENISLTQQRKLDYNFGTRETRKDKITLTLAFVLKIEKYDKTQNWRNSFVGLSRPLAEKCRTVQDSAWCSSE